MRTSRPSVRHSHFPPAQEPFRRAEVSLNASPALRIARLSTFTDKEDSATP
jgi:hypothetical protein